MVTSRKNWYCPTCNWRSSRRWNITRHIKLKHGASVSPLRTGEVYDDLSSSTIPSISQTFQLPKPNIKGIEENSEDTRSQDWWTEMPNLMKNYIELANATNSAQTMNGLRQYAGFQAAQLRNIYANNWILPKAEILGISGFFCRRCLTFTFRPIRQLGYDETEKGKHIDLHGCVDTNKIQLDSTDQSETPLEEIAGHQLTNAVNYFMPGIKYLVAFDVTSYFVNIMSKHIPEFTLRLIGIPDRWYLYPLEEKFNLQCVDRAVTDLGKRVRLEDAELVDFLRRIQATYAIIQINRETSMRWFGVRITNVISVS
jgi:hypothetical protein